eukprot:CAMPEP_0198340856 /NCGR_PEP_ID=MMETSP1450-20131203/46003_1 /TAXON_ID=753684 ORGANISM="Madagascaria erythrocladiodes, Strain CCMP3234" /NCGR_SAMPLE_ID=MMETSP1450 /ASSEMBLY_ACC=CAM_ASM_001115 /LENGTH=69 /DNA_ID=CAMNT_0044045851 /DNA_START=93 /DNA_END=299 /DNA_ORIENTATION=-
MSTPTGKIVFALNGERVELDARDVDPRMTLNEYLRDVRHLTGVKHGCGEGGCGACAVATATLDADGTTV